MLTLITGGSGSGKSAFAENLLIQRSNTNRYYLATMIVYDEESQKRIQKHRDMRKDKNFVTLEVPLHIGDKRLPCNSNVLVECMANLVANHLYEKEGAKAHATAHILQEIQYLNRHCNQLIIVTNEVFCDGIFEDTMHYQKVLGDINKKIAYLADEVIEVVYGIPVYIKK